MWMLVGANGYAMDEQDTRFDAVVFDAGRIRAVGRASDLRLQFGAQVTKVVDVDGATIVPGFVDNHVHISGVAEQAMQLDVTGVTSKQDLLNRVRHWAQGLPPDEWVVGGGWDENQFADATLPTMAELNDAALGHPLLLARVCRHNYLANGAAFARAGLGTDPANPAGGFYGRDAQGQLNGRVFETAYETIASAVPTWTKAKRRESLQKAMQKALAAGITAVHTDDTRYLGGFTDTWLYYHQLIRNDGIRLRVHELVDWKLIDECLRSMPELPASDDWLSHGAAKLFSDGSFGGRTAWLAEPYADAPETSGMPIYSQAELNERVRVAHAAGFPVAIHAIGDAALAATMTALELAPPVAGRDRIVHAELVRANLVRRMIHLGAKLAIDIQPRFTCSDFPWLVDRLGAERAAYACAWRTLKDAGLHIGGGSDAPIEPIEPLLGMHAAVTRQLPHRAEPGYFMEQALSPREAVQLFTRDGCYAIGMENHKGCILPGWLGDVTVLDRDIVMPQNPDDIKDAQIRYTIVGGHIAYDAAGRTWEALT